MIDKNAIRDWQELNEESQSTESNLSADSNLSATATESASDQEIDSSCSNALLRPFSIREVGKNRKSMRDKSNSDTSMEDASDAESEDTETRYEKERSAAEVGSTFDHTPILSRLGMTEDDIADELWDILVFDSPRTAEARLRSLGFGQYNAVLFTHAFETALPGLSLHYC